MRLIRRNVERIAETEADIAKLKAIGFKELKPSSEIPEEPKTELTAMNVTQLKALAKKNGVDGYFALTKDELIAVLKDVI